MAEHIVAVFKSEGAATAAEESLKSAGVPSSTIRRYLAGEVGRDEITPTEDTSTHTSSGGFWSWLFGGEETTRSAYTHDAYDRTAAAGNVVLSVTVDDSKIHDAIVALEAHDPVEIDEHSDEVEGGATTPSMAPLTGASATGRDFSSSEVAQAGAADTTLPPGREPVASGTTSGTPSLSAGASPVPGLASTAATPTTGTEGVGKGEQVIPLAEEQLEVGKRTVDRGTTRIRRYVVEKPVEENINLRSERVMVEKRQPLETTGTPGAGAFEERVIEVRETAEEPVVAKRAHVVEEVVVGREVTERTETVKDAVRREEIEISKDGEVKP